MDRGSRERGTFQGNDREDSEAVARPAKPPWLRVKLPVGENVRRVRELMRGRSLHTVCEEAMCPNLAECWGCGTATFLILGDVCTRSCAFCAVRTGRPEGPPDHAAEAERVAEAVVLMQLRHVVVTSVTRDDLPDGGAAGFAAVVAAVRAASPDCAVELLVPDFGGDATALETVLRSRPDVLGHNMETVLRLHSPVRPQARYRRSLELLERAAMYADRAPSSGPKMLVKSGIMAGLGETLEEILDVMRDLRGVGCDLLTVGQYLSPTRTHRAVSRYYTPEEFLEIKKRGLDMGFRGVESAPLVRSSYHAEAQTGR